MTVVQVKACRGTVGPVSQEWTYLKFTSDARPDVSRL